MSLAKQSSVQLETSVVAVVSVLLLCGQPVQSQCTSVPCSGGHTSLSENAARLESKLYQLMDELRTGQVRTQMLEQLVQNLTQQLRVHEEHKPCSFGPYGGNGGQDYSYKAMAMNRRLNKIRVYYDNDWLRGLRFLYARSWSVRVGTGGSDSADMTLGNDEFITKVEGMIQLNVDEYGLPDVALISSIRFVTNSGRYLGWHGPKNQTGLYFRAEGGALRYMEAKHGQFINNLVFHFDNC